MWFNSDWFWYQSFRSFLVFFVITCVKLNVRLFARLIVLPEIYEIFPLIVNQAPSILGTRFTVLLHFYVIRLSRKLRGTESYLALYNMTFIRLCFRLRLALSSFRPGNFPNVRPQYKRRNVSLLFCRVSRMGWNISEL